MKVAPRMALMIIIGTGFVLGLAGGYNYFSARQLLEEELSLKARYLAQATALRIEVDGRAVEKIVQLLEVMLEEQERDIEEEYLLLERVLAASPEIYGTAIAPYPIGPAPYVCRAEPPDQGFERYDLHQDNYKYEVWDWFTLPHDLNRAIWTEPYFDEGAGRVLMVTRAAPLHNPNAPDEFAGVVTGDVSLEKLRKMFSKLEVGRSGYAFLISSTGRFISHPVQDFVMNETIFSQAEERGSESLRRLGQRMIRGEKGFDHYVSLATGKESWLAFAPVSSSGWSIGLVFPKEELLDVVFALTRESVLLGLVGFVMLFAVAMAIARSITRPLRLLGKAVGVLSTGDLDARLPVIKGKDEVAGLASAVEAMRGDLKRHIADLKTTTAAKERIESEINIAHEIQMSLVPHTFPPFPERTDMEVYAVLEPARQIGGDFYDFFMLNKDELCLVIGDVSGKGIPAALFMAVTRTLLRSIWQDEQSPAAALSRMNNELAQDNDSCMFVTVFCARINLATGSFTYASGGHNPPFLLRKGQGAEFIPNVTGMVVGSIPDVPFDEGRLNLSPGDAVFLYTDGLTEAMNEQGELSGDDWALGEVDKFSAQSCAEMVKGMRTAIENHTRGAEQSDDITMVSFRYTG